MDLTSQVPMQYCPLQHQTSLPSPVHPQLGVIFCFGSIFSFFLKLFLHWSPVAYWAPSDLGSSSFSVLSFCLFIPFIELSRQEYWSAFPVPSLVDHVLSEPCDCGFQSVCPLKEKDKRLMEASWWERLPEGELGLVLMGGAMLSKSLIQFSVDGCVPSLILTRGQTPQVFDLRPNGGVNEDNGDLLQKVLCTHCHTQCLWPCSRPLPTHAFTGDSWTLTGRTRSLSCGVTGPSSWVLVCTGFCLCPTGVCFPVLCKFWWL